MKNVRTNKNNLIFSIVLCTYNREKHIERCLHSLVNQNFPKDQYEIIVVDDGSTDATIKLASKYPVRIIKHKQNNGVAAARNTGLKAIKGDIYICFDDDCIADKNWLVNLAKIYKTNNIKKISGVAGFIELMGNRLIEKYMDETGYGNPSPISYVTSKSLFGRFFAYLQNMFFPAMQTGKKIMEVGEIWGANCSFPVEILKAVRGWDETLSGVEDTDLCDRIKKTFPKNKFICTKDAIIYHDHQLTFKDFLKKPYGRGIAILNFYIKNDKIPPFFPFPISIIAIFLLLFFLHPLYAFLSLILLPQIFYSWWIIKAVKKMKSHFLAFPYLQSFYELASVLGLIRGYIKRV